MKRQDRIRRQLEEKLAQLKERLARIESSLSREKNPLEMDFEEQASVRQNDEVLDGLEAHERAQIAAIRAALEKLEEGSYGICENCGGKIATARLEALPQTTTCIECASKLTG